MHALSHWLAEHVQKETGMPECREQAALKQNARADTLGGGALARWLATSWLHHDRRKVSAASNEWSPSHEWNPKGQPQLVEPSNM
mmetsp:Transcript_79423/g.225114  ORF Transcript_79423/g.225114 Transcript_79423/m.225114 type:complete len:85 (+) Transcript_79423:83-337(+)